MNTDLLETCFEKLSDYKDLLLEDGDPDDAFNISVILDDIQNVLEN